MATAATGTVNSSSPTHTHGSPCDTIAVGGGIILAALGAIAAVACIVGLSLSSAGYSLRIVPLVGDALTGPYGILILSSTAVGGIFIAALSIYSLAKRSLNLKHKTDLDNLHTAHQTRLAMEKGRIYQIGTSQDGYTASALAKRVESLEKELSQVQAGKRQTEDQVKEQTIVIHVLTAQLANFQSAVAGMHGLKSPASAQANGNGANLYSPPSM